MTHDLSGLDPIIALIKGDDEITEEHAKQATAVFSALPVEAFKDGAQALTAAADLSRGSINRERLNKLNVLMSRLPEWGVACRRYAEWKYPDEYAALQAKQKK